MKSLSLPSFSMFSNKSKSTTTRQTQDNGDGNDNEKSEGIVRRISRSLFPRMSGSRKKGDSVYETETSSPDLNIISSRSSYSINNNNTSTSGNEGSIKNALSGSFAVVGNFDSASSRIPGDRYPNDGYDDNNDADDKTILSRTSSMSSVKSTPMQLLTIRADQMLPNKIITDSTTLAVKEIAALESTTKSPVTTPSKQDNSSSIYVECDKIIDSIAQGWNDSLQAIPYDRLSKKSLIFSAKKKASVDLKTYMTRLVRIINKIYDGSMYDRQGSGVRCLLIATIYLEKIMKLNDDLELTDLNIHRLFLGAFMLALKMYEDELPPEASLAEYGGVSIQQLHSIESKFFELMRFNIFLQTDEYLNLFSKIRMLCQLDFSPEFPSWVGLENKSG